MKNEELNQLVKDICDTTKGYTDDELQSFRLKFQELVCAKYHKKDIFGIAKRLNKRETLADDTISIRSMINSCLIYRQTYKFINENTNNLIDYGHEYCMKYANNDRDYVVALYYSQKKRFATAKVYTNVFTDDEGCSYNSVEW